MTKQTLLISEAGNMKRSRRGLSAWIEGMNPQLGWVLRQADRNQAGTDRFVQGAADGPGKIGFRRSLQWHFLGNNIFIDTIEFALLDHVPARDLAVRRDHARQPLLEVRHHNLPFLCDQCVWFGRAWAPRSPSRRRASLASSICMVR